MKDLAQLLRAAIKHSGRFDHPGARQADTRQLSRVGRCLCGRLLSTHFTARNEFIPCSHRERVGA